MDNKIRKFKLENIIEARKRRLNRESKGTDEEYYKNLMEEMRTPFFNGYKPNFYNKSKD